MKPFRAGVRFALLLTVVAALPAFAAEKPINISIFPPLAIAKPEDSVTAFRFNLIYGKNTAVKVIDIGLVNHTTTGLSNGLQWGFLNLTEGEFKGLQVAAININKGTAHGLQWATVNYTQNSSGLQLAMVNYARKMDGVQVGVVNIIKEGGMFPVMVIANWGK
jgi:hypothetical protein